MKNEHALKSCGALSVDGNAVRASAVAAPSARRDQAAPDEEQRDVATMSDDFRAMLIERYNAPYKFASCHRHSGLTNETHPAL
jgi:hypothetical protein